ncbi:MAG: tRNA (N6-threonylcarbamoyladenosine(37)-N6)-methyltransferase TrmO [Solirubrobacterales bacterium]
MREIESRLRMVGEVSSPLTDPAQAPKQGDEGAPEAWIILDDEVGEAVGGIEPGAEMIVITWLDRADREVLSVHPRGDVSRPPLGVFATRSPARPNPIGLHRVQIREIDGSRLRVAGLEAVDGTPVLDLKPVLGGISER